MSISQYQAVILAAGRGTRMRSKLPKVLHKVCGLTLIERSLRAVAIDQISRIVVVAGYGEDLVREEIQRISKNPLFAGKEIVVASQPDQRGTGHAVMMALPHVQANPGAGSRALIIPGDSPLLDQATVEKIIAKDHQASTPEFLIVSYVLSDPTGFGRILRKQNGDFVKIVEQRDCTDAEREISEVNAAIYCADIAELSASLPSLKASNAQGELYFTDVPELTLKNGKRVGVEFLPDWLRLAGANSRNELLELETLRRREISQKWLEHGVTLEHEASVFIDEDVVLGTDVFLGAGTKLQGNTTIADGVIVEGNSLIRNSHIESDVLIRLSCYVDSASVGSGSKIGPFAHLRPESKLHKDVHIGNFVEVKKSELFEGVKANHLTYIGDASIGSRTNVGAGTITCNYDGYRKHRTTIGENVFIGSNTSLVAPVTLNDGAITGAGSVITKEVPVDALALERNDQRIVDGYAKKRREKFSKEK